ncbi:MULTISPECIES: MIP family channel protein [Methanobrevibacter]|uniref:MIP family channel protein n=1 Tax=Methanobrevibacter TaxID=2172 RepID=UPI0015B8E6CB|nr:MULTISPECIES: MIP family channel protein [Methanobrevibacter]MBS7257655.1 MIP family channel protein [Methanobrevibacter sp.]MCI7428184.1 MIP family channel protein [Methanobrevibacter sp.]MDD6775738.1 MIP family channel protein [Methanobacteriaceae archaeon]MDY3097731.1 MIP family channel protein [Methanobrevibacter sp.]
MKRYISELIGTMVLVLFGCGSAAIAGSVLGNVGIALAFGLSIVAMAYVIGDISGCHINPAVSIGMWIDGRLETKDLVMYIVFQCIGAIIGIGLLAVIINSAPTLGGYTATGLGQNGFGAASSVGLNVTGAIIVEIILTFVFVFTVLGVTKKAENGAVAGIVIGLTLAFVHIMGIPLTGTSVNPARSIAPALFIGGQALQQVWVFIVAPIIGAIIAGTLFKGLTSEDN